MSPPVLGTILNVNDTEASRYLATLSLRRAGYRVLEAATGTEALSCVAEARPDCIVLDIKLPDMSGYEVCERLKMNPATANIAIIHTSATFITAEKKVRGLKAGADVYLTQPFDPEELIATVNSVLRVRFLEQDARRRAEQLQEADRRKDEFLAMLAHELRNPLAAVTTATALAQRLPSSEPRLAKMLNVIQRQSHHLSRMVDDLLDVSRITRGKVELRRARVDLRTIMGQLMTVVSPMAAQRGVTLDAPALDAPLWLDGDAHRLEQVFTNLLDNATKYTEAGGHASLSVAVEAKDARRQVVVRIRDSGIGIAPEMLVRIFEPFTQVDNSLDRSRGGLGIGLMLVQSLVELHGGTVTAVSAGLGLGSEFTVRLPLPLEPSLPAEGLSPSPQSFAGAGRSRRILLVEDNADARLTLHELMESWGHQVDVAFDGIDGVTKALQLGVELAVVDIGLPGLDGYGVAERLRAQMGPNIRLVALTGYGTLDARQRAFQSGFDVHLTKPVNPDELARTLEGL
ncbi:response regulator [Pyxidicoccus sp. 3LFB2]